MAGPKHHEKPATILPPWVLRERDDCIVELAGDAYLARNFAIGYGADKLPSCQEHLRAAEKSLAKLANPKKSVAERTKEGARAARKFWEAKVCARQKMKTKPPTECT